MRIWASARGSGWAEGAGALPFQRAFNIEESCERSGAEPGLDGAPDGDVGAAVVVCAAAGDDGAEVTALPESAAVAAEEDDIFAEGAAAALQVARMPSPSSTMAPEDVELDDAAGDLVAGFVFGDVLVDAGGDELLDRELDLALFGINGENDGLDALALAEHVARMVDAAVGDDLADVDEAVDTIGDLNESAEVHEFRYGAFDLGADGEFPLDFKPGIGECLLETERDAALLGARGRLDGENDSVDAVALAEQVGGVADLFSPRHL